MRRLDAGKGAGEEELSEGTVRFRNGKELSSSCLSDGSAVAEVGKEDNGEIFTIRLRALRRGFKGTEVGDV